MEKQVCRNTDLAYIAEQLSEDPKKPHVDLQKEKVGPEYYENRKKFIAPPINKQGHHGGIPERTSWHDPKAAQDARDEREQHRLLNKEESIGLEKAGPVSPFSKRHHDIIRTALERSAKPVNPNSKPTFQGSKTEHARLMDRVNKGDFGGLTTREKHHIATALGHHKVESEMGAYNAEKHGGIRGARHADKLMRQAQPKEPFVGKKYEGFKQVKEEDLALESALDTLAASFGMTKATDRERVQLGTLGGYKKKTPPPRKPNQKNMEKWVDKVIREEGLKKEESLDVSKAGFLSSMSNDALKNFHAEQKRNYDANKAAFRGADVKASVGRIIAAHKEARKRGFSLGKAEDAFLDTIAQSYGLSKSEIGSPKDKKDQKALFGLLAYENAQAKKGKPTVVNKEPRKTDPRFAPLIISKSALLGELSARVELAKGETKS